MTNQDYIRKTIIRSVAAVMLCAATLPPLPAMAETAEVNVFKGAAVVSIDGAPSQEILERTSFSFNRTIEVRTPGAFAAISVDLGELGFVRVDYGRVEIRISEDRTVFVNNHGGSVYIDEVKKLKREGSGRFIITH
jgi:hypothetical protein